MKVFIIHDSKTCKRIKPSLSKFGEIVCLTEELGDIAKYSRIFKDNSEKILAISPDKISLQLPVEELSKITKLKGIALTSSWYKFLDTEYCKKNNIWITTTTGANSNSVAEYAIWMMLSLTKNLPMQICGKFKIILDEKHRCVELIGKTVGIVGLGRIGAIIAKKCTGLGLNVIYWSRNKKDVPYKYFTLSKILKESDVIFNCLEICEGTKDILTHELLNKMKSTTYYVSILGGAGWGPADDNYIVNMVKSGKLAGMAVENEDAKGYKFAECKNCNVFRPGTYAWYTKEALEKIESMWIESIIGIATSKSVHRVV